jgi:hypothetical protein
MKNLPHQNDASGPEGTSAKFHSAKKFVANIAPARSLFFAVLLVSLVFIGLFTTFAVK